MYINPVVVGCLGTLLAELVGLILYAAVKVWRNK
jgi:hypothetical protein